MNGLLEQILAALAANTAALNANTAAKGGAAATTDTSLGLVTLTNRLDGVTAEQITALIMPHVGNDTIKGELGVAMRALGVNALAEAPPHLFGALYQQFQAIIAKYIGGGQAQPGSGSASII